MNQSNIHVRYNFEEKEEELAGEFEISNSKILNFARRGRKVKKKSQHSYSEISDSDFSTT